MEVSRKVKEKVVPTHVFDVSCCHSQVDGVSSGTKMSLDEELGIPSVVTPNARKVVKTCKGDVCICKSTHAKYLVDTLRYDGFLSPSLCNEATLEAKV